VTSENDLLADVEERNHEAPRTFKILSNDERASLAKGDLAQLCFDDKERMWVEIVRVSRSGGETTYYGRLRSVPLFVPVKVSDVVRFEPRNVLKIERKPTNLPGKSQ
jgi:hypothetical protein